MKEKNCFVFTKLTKKREEEGREKMQISLKKQNKGKTMMMVMMMMIVKKEQMKWIRSVCFWFVDQKGTLNKRRRKNQSSLISMKINIDKSKRKRKEALLFMQTSKQKKKKKRLKKCLFCLPHFGNLWQLVQV